MRYVNRYLIDLMYLPVCIYEYVYLLIICMKVYYTSCPIKIVLYCIKVLGFCLWDHPVFVRSISNANFELHRKKWRHERQHAQKGCPRRFGICPVIAGLPCCGPYHSKLPSITRNFDLPHDPARVPCHSHRRTPVLYHKFHNSVLIPLRCDINYDRAQLSWS